ncbi:MAG: hypothetical protein HYW48_02905 [Deltaproteobacteria bacterium]|nr:hypothetical protein [Deltaproteobacteria bacterium]
MELRKTLFLCLLGGTACKTASSNDPVLDAWAAQEGVSEETGKLREKLATLWVRVDDLGNTIARQQQQIQVMENRLLSKENRTSEEGIKAKEVPVTKNKTDSLLVEPIAVGGVKKQELFSRMSYAKRLFSEKRFGKAFIEFSRLEREFPPELSMGEQRFWVARCWLELGEFQSAWQFFRTYIEEFPGAAYVASAQFLMAKAEIGMGRREDAVIRLKNIIGAHPYESSAESAKHLLATLEKEKEK